MRLFKTRSFIRFAESEGIEDDALLEAANRAELGLIDADLGGGLIKQRVARSNAGKSGGFRTLLAFKTGDKVFFLFGFAKNEIANINKFQLKIWRITSKYMLSLSDGEIKSLLIKREIMEIKSNV
jgi:hypothetical protein